MIMERTYLSELGRVVKQGFLVVLWKYFRLGTCMFQHPLEYFRPSILHIFNEKRIGANKMAI